MLFVAMLGGGIVGFLVAGAIHERVSQAAYDLTGLFWLPAGALVGVFAGAAVYELVR